MARRKTYWGLCCGLIVATSSAVWLSSYREPTLQDLSTRIVPVGQGNRWERTLWLSNRKLLIISRDDEPAVKAGMWRGHADVLDLVTHLRTRLATLSNRLNDPKDPIAEPPEQLSASVDGTWLQYKFVRPRHREVYIDTAVNLNTGAHREWRHIPCLRSFWSDDHTIVDVREEEIKRPGSDMTCFLPSTTIHDLIEPRLDRSFKPLTAENAELLSQFEKRSPMEVFADYTQPSRVRITRVWFDKSSGGFASSRETFPVASGTVFTRALSRRPVAAIIDIRHMQRSPILEWLQTIVPQVASDPVETEWLSIYRSDRNSVERIAPVSTADDAKVQEVKWLPDGKRISFIYRGMLYVMPLSSSG